MNNTDLLQNQCLSTVQNAIDFALKSAAEICSSHEEQQQFKQALNQSLVYLLNGRGLSWSPSKDESQRSSEELRKTAENLVQLANILAQNLGKVDLTK